MEWSFACLESDSLGSTALLKTDFVLEKRFDFSSRLAGKTNSSTARPTEWSLMGTWSFSMSLFASPSGDAEISFSGAKSALLSLNPSGVKETSSFVGQVSLWILFQLSRQNENSQEKKQAYWMPL